MNWFNSFLRIYPSEAAWIMHTIQEWFSNHWDLVWLTVRIFFTLRCLECYTDLADLQKHIKRSLQVHALQTRRVIILLCLTSLEDVTSLICSGNSTTVEAWDVRRRYDCFFLLAWKYSDIAVRLLTPPPYSKIPPYWQINSGWWWSQPGWRRHRRQTRLSICLNGHREWVGWRNRGGFSSK